MTDLGAFIVLAHGGALAAHDGVMLLLPTMPILLLATMFLAISLQRHGYLGRPDRTIDVSAAIATISSTLSLGAGAIHFAEIQEHIAYDMAFGVFFIGIAWFQALWALAYLRRPTRSLAAGAAFVNVAVLLLWLASRTVGLPYGPTPGVPEAVGALDLIATGFEVTLVSALLPVLWPQRFPQTREPLPYAKGWALTTFFVVVVALLTTAGLLGASEMPALTAQ